MDTSLVYIDMCKAATEIQKKWVPAYGDCYYGGIYREAKIIYVIQRYATPPYMNTEGNVWLPRQDQLQDMVTWRKIFIVKTGVGYQQVSTGEVLLGALSMEQLWLKFVMKEKFHKVWESGE